MDSWLLDSPRKCLHRRRSCALDKDVQPGSSSCSSSVGEWGISSTHLCSASSPQGLILLTGSSSLQTSRSQCLLLTEGMYVPSPVVSHFLGAWATASKSEGFGGDCSQCSLLSSKAYPHLLGLKALSINSCSGIVWLVWTRGR